MTTAHPEILLVPQDAETVSCNGGGGALGHPKVYYTFHHQDEVVCGYCDRLFTKKDVAGAVPYNKKGAA
ncbi:MAG TPA: zinc-finger domain-containing protein [Alphaproteobacteria bacterium]|jgi:uncharacterized Zn-finger protein|nr:zinc-finger domain-containing protein [Alphaproteobacteria bacterium]